MDDKALCDLPVTARASSLPGAKPFSRASGSCPEPFCDWVEKPPTPSDTCFVATANLTRAERESRAARPLARASSSPWDGQSTPKWLDRVDAHLHFSDDEAAKLRKNGFVALDRLSYGSYAVAFHDVFQQQMPVYVGVDAILNAVFHASETVLEQAERRRLTPKLAAMLDKMRTTLARSRSRYANETFDDLDVYLAVADALLRHREEPKPVRAENLTLAADLAAKATAAGALEPVTLFGRERMIDFTQFTPRSHYANVDYGGTSVGKETIFIADYFRSVMWLSRLELNLASRSCRSSHPGEAVDATETPREGRDAVALADLALRAGALDDLKAFEDTYAVFAGAREDVSVPDLLNLAHKARISPSDPDAGDKLRAAIGDRWRRTARIHYMPEGATELPAIATLLGARVVPDIAPITGLVHDKIPERKVLGAADVGYLLGHDRAKAYLTEDLGRFGGLQAALDKGRSDLAASARGKADVYSTWIGAVARLADKPDGVVPSFMRREAYADMRMSSALAGYAQIRHTFVLLAGQGYDAYGCEIPDGWVEPALTTYRALGQWARAARAAAPGVEKFFRRVEEVLAMLVAISEVELSGAPLTEPQRRWLAMVSEHTPIGGYGDSGEPPKWTGWYFDLFPDREHGAGRAVDLVADYATLTNADQVRYLGVEKAVMGAFVIDTGGEPRVMVGPVAKPYEALTPIAARLDDKAARAFKDKAAPWTASYLAAAPPEPAIRTRFVTCKHDVRMIAESETDLGAVTFTLLDHHGDAITGAVTRDVGKSPVAFSFTVSAELAAAAHGVEGAHLRVKAPRWDFVLGVGVYPSDDGEYPRAQSSYGLDVALGSMSSRPEPEP